MMDLSRSGWRLPAGSRSPEANATGIRTLWAQTVSLAYDPQRFTSRSRAMGIGMKELLIILLVVLLVFGAKKLKTIGSDLGGAVKGFKSAMKEGEEEGDETAKQIKQSMSADAEFPENKASTTTKNTTDHNA